MGQKTKQFSLKVTKNNQIQIDTETLSNGVYFIQWQTDNGTTNIKFIKQ